MAIELWLTEYTRNEAQKKLDNNPQTQSERGERGKGGGEGESKKKTRAHSKTELHQITYLSTRQNHS